MANGDDDILSRVLGQRRSPNLRGHFSSIGPSNYAARRAYILSRPPVMSEDSGRGSRGFTHASDSYTRSGNFSPQEMKAYGKEIANLHPRIRYLMTGVSDAPTSTSGANTGSAAFDPWWSSAGGNPWHGEYMQGGMDRMIRTAKVYSDRMKWQEQMSKEIDRRANVNSPVARQAESDRILGQYQSPNAGSGPNPTRIGSTSRQIGLGRVDLGPQYGPRGELLPLAKGSIGIAGSQAYTVPRPSTSPSSDSRVPNLRGALSTIGPVQTQPTPMNLGPNPFASRGQLSLGGGLQSQPRRYFDY